MCSRFQVILTGFLFSTHGGDYVENEDPGRNFVLLKIVRSRVVSYTPLVSRSR